MILAGGEKRAGKVGADNCGKSSNCATVASNNVGWVCERLRAGVAGAGCESDAGWAQQLTCWQAQLTHLSGDADDAFAEGTLCVHTSRRLNRMANADFTQRT